VHLICHGYKDALYIQMACWDAKLGKKHHHGWWRRWRSSKAIIDVSQQIGVRPIIGGAHPAPGEKLRQMATSRRNAKFGLFNQRK